MQRTTLTIRLTPDVEVHRIDAVLSGATIVEAHEGVDPDAPPPWPPVDESAPGFVKPGVPRTELFSMFRYKSLLAANSATVPSAKVTLVPRCVVESDGSPASRLYLASGLLQLTLLCAWEPVQCLGVESITVYGCHRAPAAAVSSSSVVRASPVVYSPPAGTSLPKKRGRSEERISLPPPHVAWSPPTPSYHPPAPAVVAPHSYAAYSPSPLAAAPVTLPESHHHATAAAVHVPVAPAASADAGHAKPLVGCVVVLSGFVNPLRAELRDKALSLGATVQNDWTPRATHLIAAMLNTPKVAATKASGHGWIVSKEWVLHAFLAKARPKEATYRLAGDSACAGGDDPSVDSPPPPLPPTTTGGAGAAFRFVM